jgi:hypothetical protein
MVGENEGRREDDYQHESSLTIKWGLVFTIAVGLTIMILGFFGWLLVSSMSHGDRITKLETQLEIHIPQIKNSLEKLSTITEEIRNDQIRRQRTEK